MAIQYLQFLPKNPQNLKKLDDFSIPGRYNNGFIYLAKITKPLGGFQEIFE